MPNRDIQSSGARDQPRAQRKACCHSSLNVPPGKAGDTCLIGPPGCVDATPAQKKRALQVNFDPGNPLPMRIREASAPRIIDRGLPGACRILQALADSRSAALAGSRSVSQPGYGAYGGVHVAEYAKSFGSCCFSLPDRRESSTSTVSLCTSTRRRLVGYHPRVGHSGSERAKCAGPSPRCRSTLPE